MKYSYTWLKELSGTKKTSKQLAELLTMRAFELEDIKTEGKETQMEFSILPNRGHDALSHTGLAREICAVEGRKFILKFDFRKFLKSNFRKKLKVEIKDNKLCPRYIGAVLENIKVGPSPKWMQARLLVCGIKPINNIVDITNNVMLETGQPMHAFDATKIKDQRSKINIIVRRAKKGEKIKLLDEKIYELNENNLVIADSEKALALAGVMGGFESSITNKTTSIILESANFNSTNVRKTRTAHNIITESSHRFERDIDPNLAEMAMTQAIILIKQIGGKNIELTALTDIYPKKVKPWQIKINTNYVNNLLGEDIPVAKMKGILENLGLAIKISGKLLNCEIPTRRIDLKSQEDIIEEIGRVYGYENIREQPPRVELSEVEGNRKRSFENKLRDILTGLGFSEVMNYSFYGIDDIEKCNLKVEDHIEVANPLSSEQQYLRRSLLPNVLKNIELNLKNFDKLSLYEIGNVFKAKDGASAHEFPVMYVALADPRAKENLFSSLKGNLSALLEKIGISNAEYKMPTKNYFFHPTRVAQISANKLVIGKIGEINPQIAARYGIEDRIVIFFLRIDELLKIVNPEKQYRPISRFPIVERDISMFIEKDTKYADISTKIQKNGGNLVKNIDLFDVFEKEGEKSLALRIKIGSDTKTLTSEEIDSVMREIITSLEKDLKVKLRK
jgi:phenylalanyl-tRNA synthetase beta chain